MATEVASFTAVSSAVEWLDPAPGHSGRASRGVATEEGALLAPERIDVGLLSEEVPDAVEAVSEMVLDLHRGGLVSEGLDELEIGKVADHPD